VERADRDPREQRGAQRPDRQSRAERPEAGTGDPARDDGSEHEESHVRKKDVHVRLAGAEREARLVVDVEENERRDEREQRGAGGRNRQTGSLYWPPEMGSRLLWRRSATAVGLYSAMLFGILGTVFAARSFSLVEFGLYATVMAATGFFQSLLDLTVEESLTKYGFRYVTAEDWGRLRRLFRRALELKLAGGVLAGAALLGLAPVANWVFDAQGLFWPLVLAAGLPLAQAPENVATTALLLRGRYDLRAAFQSFSMGLRLIAIVVGSQFGLAETMAGIVFAQVVGTAAVSAVGIVATT